MDSFFIYWTAPDGTTQLAGELQTVGGAGVQRFSYDAAWLRSPGFALGEDLPAMPGAIFPPGGASEFGVFLDAGPDTWGRRILSRKLTPPPRSTTQYIAAAADESRQGALRFATQPDGPFLSDGGPEPLSSIESLYEEVRGFQSNHASPGEVARLLRAATSQGGLRPKASVRDDDGSIWIAKFPSEDDTYDVETCEAAALNVARTGGLAVPDFRLIRVNEDRAILVIKRFDRTATGRFGYQSMRTATRVGPYEELNYKMMASAAGFHSGERGVLEIVARAALNITVHNIDDHGRNIGLLQNGQGRWDVSPVFDVVPFPWEAEGTPLSSAVRDRSLDAVMGLDWGVPRSAVAATVQRVSEAAQHVYTVARDEYGLDPETAEIAERFRSSVAR
ncbi:serine/threonine-protein kinase HipA [Ruaniaceae bacterium KH17]|nr:serine/threonine-protein kinase HipA [Ruaniaceae bacterium KH17]